MALPSAPGDTLVPGRIGPYVIGNQIPAGSCGPTFRATREDSGETFALTFVPTPTTGEKAGLFDFVQGFRKAHPLPHPGVVLLEQVRPGGRHPFLATRFLPAGTLADWTGSPPPAAEVVDSVRQIALAVDFLHGQGIGRTPLGPDDVLVGPDGKPHLHEFVIGRQVYLRELSGKAGSGLERMRDPGPGAHAEPRAWSASATPDLEAISGRRTRVGSTVDDPLIVDLFGLGNLLYLGLTGRPACEHPGLPGLLATLDEKGPTPPSLVAEGLHPDLDAVCRRALGLEQTDRYASAGALAEDLERILREGALTFAPMESGSHGASGDASSSGRSSRRRAALLSATPPSPARSRALLLLSALAVLVGVGIVLPTVFEHGWEERPAEGTEGASFRTDLLVPGDRGADDPAREIRERLAAYSGELERLLAEGSARDVVLAIEASLDLEGGVEETVAVFHRSLAAHAEPIRRVLVECGADTFDRLLAPALGENESAATQILDLVAGLLLDRANLRLLSGVADLPPERALSLWETYQTVNGRGRTNQFEADLASLPPGVAERALERLRSQGLLPE